MQKDYTKYQFEGTTYSKNRLILAVIKEYLKRHQATLPALQKAFPKELQGSAGVFCPNEEFNTKKRQSSDVEKRYFSAKNERLVTHDEQEIVVSNQWGLENTKRFIAHATSLGLDIQPQVAPLTNEEIIQQFLHKPAFARNYQTWPDETLHAFCDIIRLANSFELDVFIVKMEAGNAFRIGRREQGDFKAKSVFATFDPVANKINYRQRFGYKDNYLKEELSLTTFNRLRDNSDLQQFNLEYPITRAAYWPSDYDESENASMNARIWKVSHSPISFKEETLKWLTDNSLLAVHQNTGNGSADCFRKIKIGDIVNLGHGNTVYRLVRVSSDIEYVPGSDLDNQWMMRRYETIKSLEQPVKYTYEDKYKRWSPRYNGTSWEVPVNEYSLFEQDILKRYYDLTLSELGIEMKHASDETQEPTASNQNLDMSLNQILFGPPGTGKTYRTIELAVRAAEPDFTPHGHTRDLQRQSFKNKYDELVSQERIRFVTFHQSYGYEEFVEGLSAKTEGDQISYYEKDGVFKAICDDAKKYRVANSTSAVAEFEARWQQFSEKLAESEAGIRVDTLSGKTFFTITDVNNNTIRFDKSQGNSVHTMTVKTLQAAYNKEKEIKGGLQPYYGALIKYLSELSVESVEGKRERKNFVLVIDEINRGNISKVFGELITLIEPSKRLGRDEHIEVMLPYSGYPFSVPDNLYLIGTMNTADRSLALMDTALRRRFDFIEMMPDTSVLEDESGDAYSILVDGKRIDLVKLLRTLNERIAALYDREHTLGHAFFIPVINAIELNDHASALAELGKTFQNKIIPLLAEYFFEDWQKIRLVLADNQKELMGIEPIIPRQPVNYQNLFGDTEEFGEFDDQLYEYQLTPVGAPIWDEVETYTAMYSSYQAAG
ncbi:McrB family protein [Alteromonas gracilis]|uniref:McrB family protein n=1 Tax=Alteromonas gracilis TaxID=1479524 RepID=UPI002FE08D20